MLAVQRQACSRMRHCTAVFAAAGLVITALVAEESLGQDPPRRDSIVPRGRLSDRDLLVADSIRLLDEDRLDDATGTLGRAFELEKKLFGPRGDPSSMTWSRLVRLNAQRGDLRAAKELARDLLSAPGEGDWRTADARLCNRTCLSSNRGPLNWRAVPPDGLARGQGSPSRQ